jgi:hypothetical protein
LAVTVHHRIIDGETAFVRHWATEATDRYVLGRIPILTDCPVPANRLRSRLTYSVTLVWLVLSTFALPRCQFLCSGL